MNTGDAWQLRHFFYLFIGAAFLMIWVQAGLFHWRGAFRNVAMWIPVLFSPVLSAAGLALAFGGGRAIDTLFVIVFGLGVLDGLIGTYMHFAGVKHYIGGFTLRNFMAGPPVILPMIFTALAAAALLVFFFWPAQAGGSYAYIH